MGLYANEQVEYWDAETGESYKDEQELLLEEDAERQIAVGKSVAALTKTAGWEVIKEYLDTSVEHLKVVLLTSTDFEQVRRVQEAIKAYANVTAYVNHTIEAGKISENHKTPEKG